MWHRRGFAQVAKPVLADQRHAAHGQRSWRSRLPSSRLGQLDQDCTECGSPIGMTIHPPGMPGLVEQHRQARGCRWRRRRWRRTGLSAGRAGAVALGDVDVGIAQALHPLTRQLDQLVVPLDGDDLGGDQRDDRGGVAEARRSPSTLESTTTGVDGQGDDIGLADGLAKFDRRRRVDISVSGVAAIDGTASRSGTEKRRSVPSR